MALSFAEPPWEGLRQRAETHGKWHEFCLLATYGLTQTVGLKIFDEFDMFKIYVYCFKLFQ
jgi:hypothetical protein